ncbi:MAG TPA: DUF4157 domain-containing protein [Gemmatimonadaceae bacterium]|nr:DUF4157 domain-containing protein [Gemmatimonadaceae bacterium]
MRKERARLTRSRETRDDQEPFDGSVSDSLTPHARHAEPVRAPEPALDFVRRDEGILLDPAVRSAVEPKFGHSFADVRVHADGDAANAAQSVYARAFTVGNDIVFNRGEYAPESPRGASTLSHELAHTVQNERAGTQPASTSPALARLSTPTDTAESDARGAASAVTAGRSAQVSAAPSALIAADPLTEEVTRADARAAAEEEWKFNHDDVDWGATEDEKKPMRRALALKPDRSDGREISLAHEGRSALGEMSLYDTTRAEGGAKVKQFERSYAVFRLPMQMTLESLGRVQDLLTAGAPQSPAEMSKADKAVFRKLGTGTRDSERKGNFKEWASDMSDLNKQMDTYLGVYQRLQGALLQWRGMKELIVRKQKKAELQHDTAKLAKLEAPAKLIIAVIGAVQGGISAYESFRPSPVAATEPDMDLAKLEVDNDPDIRTGSQKGVSTGGAVYGTAKKGANVVGGATGITLEGVLQWAMGDSDEIAGLKASIQRLKADIEAAGERAEEFQIDAAAVSLEGTDKEARAAAIGVGTARVEARQAAEIFAGVMGGSSIDARLLALCAEAYQELRMFGEKALETYQPVAATLPAVKALVNQPGKQFEIKQTRNMRRAAEERGDLAIFDNDYESLMNAAGTARTYGLLLKRELPEWRKRADAWSAFFRGRTGIGLDQYGDRRSGR